ncbi:MAG: DNA methyltransferase [Rubrobacteraceae bacterium]
MDLWSFVGEDESSPALHLGPNPDFGRYCDPYRPVKGVDRPSSDAIAAGKNTYVYDAHTYHTKVPPEGIEVLIEHYTRPGDTILDPFCGSGMTGIAASHTGRKALLSDLSPAAIFIAYNLNTPIKAEHYLEAVDNILESSSGLESILYGTHCRECGALTDMLYMVWSYGLLCKYCGTEFVLWDVARDEKPRVRDSKIKTEFECPHCDKRLIKRTLRRTRRYPVLVGYKCCAGGTKEATAPLDDFDRSKLAEIKANGGRHELWYPTDAFPPGVNTRQPISAGITTLDKAYTPRALWAMAHLWELASSWPDEKVRYKLLFTLTSLYRRVTVFSEFRFWGGSGNTANYNVPAITNEQNVFRAFARKAKTIAWYFESVSHVRWGDVSVSTQSACALPQLPDKSVDYVFTDPPFGGNINYSEMNFLWESWLGVHTDNSQEAIVNRVQGKDLNKYGDLLTESFTEVHRVLKDRGWLTVVFHNSSRQVWNALQSAIEQAGFMVEGTRTFNKKHGTFKQFVSENAVGFDLVLHCRKSVRSRSSRKVGSSTSEVVAFVHKELEQRPSDYVIRYLHVNRENEFDFRRLYANWLADVLPRTNVSLSFEEFRTLARETISQMGGSG